MGQFPPAGLSRVVILKPRPCTPFISSNSIFRPIFLVLAVSNVAAAGRVAGETFFVGETVATLVARLTAEIV